jgi:hypothetical protein
MPDDPTPEDLALDLRAVTAGVPGLLRADVPTRTHWQLSAAAWARACAAACRRALAAEAECERLRRLVDGLADRVAAQSDLLTRRAEPRLARLAGLGDRLLACAERELVPGADLAREWALAREGVDPAP